MTARLAVFRAICAAMVAGVVYVLAATAGALDPIVAAVSGLTR